MANLRILKQQDEQSKNLILRTVDKREKLLYIDVLAKIRICLSFDCEGRKSMGTRRDNVVNIQIRDYFGGKQI